MRIKIPDMVSQQCADAITKALIAQDGVNNVTCDLVNKVVDVTCNGTFIQTVQSTLADLGYSVEPADNEAL